MAYLPTGTEESAVTIRTLSHTLYALLATLTTGKKFETGAKSAEPERVRNVETDGAGRRFRDAASCATTWNE